jgi:RNA polymerase sigma-70 factor (ECF subfamily)
LEVEAGSGNGVETNLYRTMTCLQGATVKGHGRCWRCRPEDCSVNKELPAEDLLARVARHDTAALGELYDRYAPRVYGLLAHILPARDAAEEILQEVFVRLWSESASLSQEGGSVVAWLVIAAREAAVERLRALRRNAASAGLQGPSASAEKGPGADTRKSKAPGVGSSAAKSHTGKTEAKKSCPADGARTPVMGAVPLAWLPQPKEIQLIDHRLVLLHKAINQLPKPQRQALELAVFGGLRESEIAAEMGEPLGKVRTSLRAAVTFIKHRRRAVSGIWAANI